MKKTITFSITFDDQANHIVITDQVSERHQEYIIASEVPPAGLPAGPVMKEALIRLQPSLAFRSDVWEWTSLLGYGEEWQEDSFLKIIAPEDLHPFITKVGPIALGTSFEQEPLHLLLPDGSRVSHLFDMRPFYENEVFAGIELTTQVEVSGNAMMYDPVSENAVQKSPVGVLVVNRSGKIEKVNAAFAKISGYSIAELKNKNVDQLWATEQSTFLNRLTDPQNYFQEEVRLETRNGIIIPVKVEAIPVAGENQVHKIIFVQDLTPFKELEQQMILTESRFLQTIESAPMGIAILNQAGLIESVNPALTALLGKRASELIATRFTDAVTFESAAQWERHLQAFFTRNEPFKLTTVPDKTNTTIQVHAVPVSSKDGEKRALIYFEPSGNDALPKLSSESFIANQAFTEQLELLSLVASKTSNAVIITNQSGLIEWVNDGFTRISGYFLDEVIGKKPGTILQGKDTDPETKKRIREKLNQKESWISGFVPHPTLTLFIMVFVLNIVKIKSYNKSNRQ